LRSSAYCALSLTARRVLDRIEIELADHGGTDNGKLPVTYDDFQRYGLHRQAIYPAIQETVALGFVEITEEGVAGSAEFRKPNLFRLTYRASDGVLGDGSHEWKRIADENAARIAAQARLLRPSQKQNLKYGSRQKLVRKPYRKRQINSTESTTTTHSTESTTTIDISSVSPEQPPREARNPNSGASGAAATSTPPSLASAPLALSERADILQARIAKRLGTGGWAILQDLQPDHLQNLTAMEDRGELTEAVLVRIRIENLARGAA
jgi:hypothetical protein